MCPHGEHSYGRAKGGADAEATGSWEESCTDEKAEECGPQSRGNEARASEHG
jgi:hypothetical protein